MNTILKDTQYIVLAGNYGSGKTELALNMAVQYSGQFRTTLVDLDIVNPYFRSGEKSRGNARSRDQNADAHVRNDNGRYPCAACRDPERV